MKLLRKLFGVSWKTYRAKCDEHQKLVAINESVRRSKSAQTRAKIQFSDLYDDQKLRADRLRKVYDQCTEANAGLAKERDTLVGINRAIGNEVARIRELFVIPFVSEEATKLALASREVWARHLQKPSGLRGRFTSADITTAVTVAKQEAERTEQMEALAAASMPPGKDAAPPPGLMPPPENLKADVSDQEDTDGFRQKMTGALAELQKGGADTEDDA